MANSLYSDFKERLLDPNGTGNGGVAVDFNSDTITISLHSSAYTFNDNDEDFADLSGQIDSQRESLASVTVTGGTLDAADLTFTAVAGGSTIDNYIMSKSTGTVGNDQLIGFWDQDSGGAISVATNGGDVQIQFNASGIFSF